MPALEQIVGDICRKAVRRGTHRSATPEATLARVRPLASLFGITRLGNVTGLDRIGIPVAVAVRPNSKSFSVAQGKGLTLAHAYASALMEAVEVSHAEQVPGRIWRATPREASSEIGLDVDTLPRTGKPLDQTTPLDWVEGYDLGEQRKRMVPIEVVDGVATLPRKSTRGYFLSGTNGLASGNHLLEAISAAICEVVERDAVALWNASSIRARRPLNLATVDDPDALMLLQRFRDAAITVRVFEATSDVGLATFICDISEPNVDHAATLPRCRGSGCHPNKSIALLRGLTEAAQVRLTHIAGTRDDITTSEYVKSPLENLGITLIDAIAQSGALISFEDVPTFDGKSVNDDVEWELSRLRRAGLTQVVAVDLTDADFGVPVVQVVVPGLEWDSSDPIYVPGERARRAAGGAP